MENMKAFHLMLNHRVKRTYHITSLCKLIKQWNEASLYPIRSNKHFNPHKEYKAPFFSFLNSCRRRQEYADCLVNMLQISIKILHTAIPFWQAIRRVSFFICPIIFQLDFPRPISIKFVRR